MSKAADHKIVPLEGEIDLYNSPKIKATLKGAIKEEPKKLIVDLSKVSYIDSSGLAVLLEEMRNIEFYGGKLYLTGLQENLRTIFETSRLDQAFRIFPNVESALAV